MCYHCSLRDIGSGDINVFLDKLVHSGKLELCWGGKEVFTEDWPRFDLESEKLFSLL